MNYIMNIYILMWGDMFVVYVLLRYENNGGYYGYNDGGILIVRKVRYITNNFWLVYRKVLFLY